MRLGLDCKLYRLSTGTRAAWPASGDPDNLTEVGNVQDVTLNVEVNEADGSTRDNDGWEAIAPALMKGDVSFKLIDKETTTSDDNIDAFRTAFFARTTIACAILDDVSSTVDAAGLWADFSVLKFSRDESLQNVVAYDVTIKPGLSDVAPEWAITAASA